MRRFLPLFLFALFIFPPPAAASDQFDASLRLDYVYSDTGQPLVTQYVSLTNRISGIYASSYQFTLPGSAPPLITGRDAVGPLRITTAPANPEGTLISVNFNSQVVGKGQTLQFSLQYPGPPATHRGQVWEISIPRLTSTPTFDSYQVTLTVPASFGQPAFLSPQPQTAAGNTYTFTQTGTENLPVSAAFGTLQSYAFKLDYYLKNTSLIRTQAVIALPPDTPYQHLLYTSLTPTPDNVVSDSDGNWLAQYSLSPGKTLLVTATGQAHIQPAPAAPPQTPSADDLAADLQPTDQWPVNDPRFQALAHQYTTPEAIYNYVQSALTYSPARVQNHQLTRRGAAAALDSPGDSICTDFTDVFITIARAAGIPAREIEGWAYSTTPELHPLDLSPRLLHAWPEYWDAVRGTWVSIDPTWAKTSGGTDYFHQFDFDHFAFVIHGKSSTLPLSAGEYVHDSVTSTVSVTLSSYTDASPSPVIVIWHKPLQFLPLFSTSSTLEIANPQGQAVYHLPIYVSAQNLSLANHPPEELALLPPFSHTYLPVSFSNALLPDFSTKYLAVSAGSQQITYNVSTYLFLVWHVGFAIITSGIIIGLAFVAVRAWGLYLQRLGRHHHLHR